MGCIIILYYKSTLSIAVMIYTEHGVLDFSDQLPGKCNNDHNCQSGNINFDKKLTCNASSLVLFKMAGYFTE